MAEHGSDARRDCGYAGRANEAELTLSGFEFDRLSISEGSLEDINLKPTEKKVAGYNPSPDVAWLIRYIIWEVCPLENSDCFRKQNKDQT